MDLRQKCKWEKLKVGGKRVKCRDLKAERGRLAERKRETCLRTDDSFVLFVDAHVGVLGVIGAKLLGFC